MYDELLNYSCQVTCLVPRGAPLEALNGPDGLDCILNVVTSSIADSGAREVRGMRAKEVGRQKREERSAKGGGTRGQGGGSRGAIRSGHKGQV